MISTQSKPYTVCSDRSLPHELEDVFAVIYYINQHGGESRKKFDKFCQERPKFKLEHGGRCGWTALGMAAKKGHVKLIQHIVKIGGEHLLNLGNDHGWTPLLCCVANFKEQQDLGFIAAQELIRLGADVNIATSGSSDDSIKGEMPKKATPLWVAAEKAKNLRLVELLLQHGAVANPQLSDKAQKIVDLAKLRIEQEKQLLKEI